MELKGTGLVLDEIDRYERNSFAKASKMKLVGDGASNDV